MRTNGLPAGWKKCSLGDLCDRIGVGLAMGITQYYAEVGTKLVRNQNIRPDRFEYGDILYLTNEFSETQTSKKLRSKDVITVRTGANIGDTCVVPQEFTGALTFTTLISSPTKGVLWSEYLSYYINSEYGRSEVNRLMAGGGKGNLNSGELQKFQLSVPPFPEQQKIAAILSTWDRAIELTEKLIAAKQKRKQALMQQLLTGKVRFKEFEGKRWKEVKLGKLFKERRETGYLELPLLSITSGEGIVHRDSLERKDSSNADKSKYLRICPGDIGYNTMRMWQGVSALSDHEGIVSPAYTICTPRPEVDALFMSHLFKYPPLVHVFWRYSQGMVSDTLNLKFSAFATIKVHVPARDEQELIGQVLAKTDMEITFHTRKAEQLKTQKKGLMQQLLTGKVRVNVDTETVKG